MRKTATSLLVAAACLAAAPGAHAASFDDPCGLGAPLLDEDIDTRVPWLDMCRFDVAGFNGAGPLRGVRVVFHLDGDVAEGAKAGASFKTAFGTGQCWVDATYGFSTGPLGHTVTWLNVGCNVPGEYLHLRDSPALTTGFSGRTVTIEVDPNQLPAGSIRARLADDLVASTDPDASPVTLDAVYVQTMWHYHADPVLSGSIGPGGDWGMSGGPVTLG